METNLVSSIWQKSKLLIKGLMISALVLILMIPAYFVENLVRERQERQEEAVAEVSNKWAGSQNIIGPVLVLPYKEMMTDNIGQTAAVRKLAYVLPEKLDIKAEVKPEKRSRGIYEVMLYSSDISVTGTFGPLPLQQLQLDSSMVLWNEAYLSVGLADGRGLRDELSVKWNDSSLILNPAQVNNNVMRDAFTAPVKLDGSSTYTFATTLRLNGSSSLLFTPVGRETAVSLNSTWPDPSFTGSQLADHQISDSGFTAKWKSLAHTRKFPQAWKDVFYDLTTSSFGTDLFIPVNSYQKTMRTVKYAILCILLTFAAFYLIETINKKSVHPFQYALIGLALILFYTLLLSFSEYTGFNAAYAIASVATVGLIAWFVKGILGSGKLTSILSIVLVLTYSYIFTILQIQDYALLLGSIGLFLTLAIIMHFSRKISW